MDNKLLNDLSLIVATAKTHGNKTPKTLQDKMALLETRQILMVSANRNLIDLTELVLALKDAVEAMTPSKYNDHTTRRMNAAEWFKKYKWQISDPESRIDERGKGRGTKFPHSERIRKKRK